MRELEDCCCPWQRPSVSSACSCADFTCSTERTVFDYAKLAFLRAQFDPEPVYATMTAVAAGEIDSYRNLEPKSMIEETKRNIEAPWSKKVTDGLRSRPASLQKSFEMKPETPAQLKAA